MDSALARKYTHGWGMPEELAAVAVEIAHENFRAFLAANGVKRGRLPAALRIPRPDGASTVEHRPQPTRRRAASVAEVMSVLKAGHRR